MDSYSRPTQICRALGTRANKCARFQLGPSAYDASDPIARLLTERIALNARDAGLVLQPTTLATADLRLVRIPLASADPWIALANVASVVGVAAKSKRRLGRGSLCRRAITPGDTAFDSALPFARVVRCIRQR